jgi:lipopolysaccharide export system permease protein
MDTLDRYLIREYLMYFVVVLGGLVVLYLGIDFLSNFWRTSDTLQKVMQLYWYRVPRVVDLFLAVATLMSCLLVLTHMSRQNEVLALYASGVSTVRILSTFIAVVALISTFNFLLSDPLGPVMRRKEILLSQGKDPNSEENLKSFERTDFWFRNGRLVYNVGRFVPDKNALERVSTYKFTPEMYLLERVDAKEALYKDGQWLFLNARKITYPQASPFPILEKFDKMVGSIPEAPKDFKSLEVIEETMRLKELRQYIQKNSSFGLDTTSQEVRYHERIAAVFTPLVFILLGFPFAVRPLKSNTTGRSIAFCFLVMVSYMLAMRLALSVGKSGHIPPLIAAWAPNTIFLGFAGLRFMRD